MSIVGRKIVGYDVLGLQAQQMICETGNITRTTLLASPMHVVHMSRSCLPMKQEALLVCSAAGVCFRCLSSLHSIGIDGMLMKSALVYAAIWKKRSVIS